MLRFVLLLLVCTLPLIFSVASSSHLSHQLESHRYFKSLAVNDGSPDFGSLTGFFSGLGNVDTSGPYYQFSNGVSVILAGYGTVTLPRNYPLNLIPSYDASSNTITDPIIAAAFAFWLTELDKDPSFTGIDIGGFDFPGLTGSNGESGGSGVIISPEGSTGSTPETGGAQITGGNGGNGSLGTTSSSTGSGGENNVTSSSGNIDLSTLPCSGGYILLPTSTALFAVAGSRIAISEATTIAETTNSSVLDVIPLQLLTLQFCNSQINTTLIGEWTRTTSITPVSTSSNSSDFSFMSTSSDASLELNQGSGAFPVPLVQPGLYNLSLSDPTNSTLSLSVQILISTESEADLPAIITSATVTDPLSVVTALRNISDFTLTDAEVAALNLSNSTSPFNDSLVAVTNAIQFALVNGTSIVESDTILQLTLAQIYEDHEQQQQYELDIIAAVQASFTLTNLNSSTNTSESFNSSNSDIGRNVSTSSVLQSRYNLLQNLITARLTVDMVKHVLSLTTMVAAIEAIPVKLASFLTLGAKFFDVFSVLEDVVDINNQMKDPASYAVLDNVELASSNGSLASTTLQCITDNKVPLQLVLSRWGVANQVFASMTSSVKIIVEAIGQAIQFNTDYLAPIEQILGELNSTIPVVPALERIVTEAQDAINTENVAGQTSVAPASGTGDLLVRDEERLCQGSWDSFDCSQSAAVAVTTQTSDNLLIFVVPQQFSRSEISLNASFQGCA